VLASHQLTTPRVEGLSLREDAVLEMTARGLTNAQVAERLSVSVHTVKFHLASIYRKLGVANRTEAAAVYHRERASTRQTASKRED
jgi:DNA-binding CsgD family transcriptional regulator